ncbi:SMEK domain-containing protein [uncultured Psychrobacter sp.]|uniref:SMEK domain-containing protein n=1 Tax=uncultured Psychrobacter sp. TaxID=259303 RepID=UPI00262DF7CE|nr:SMEK domain-containing protein [uncultured Psychrobacter sp.]
MKRQDYFNSIEERLNLLVLRTKSRGRLNLLDLNIHSENFFRDLLNLIYDYDLENLNNFKSNAEGVDLIDNTNKVIFQVTTTATTTKINSSIEKLTKVYQSYNLKFMIIVDQIPKLFSKAHPVQNKCISFDPKIDIIDIGIILKEISDCDIERLEKIFKFFESEIILEAEKEETLCHKIGFRNQMLSKAQWNHETTNDDRYVKRAELLGWLNKNVNNPSIRTISIRGMGGTGKTSFIGHWAKVDDSIINRPVKGLFYWSFYVERDCEKFVESLLDYFESNFNFNFEEGRKRFNSIDFFLNNFHLLPPIVAILDGLEVLQEGMNESSYGAFIDSILRDFLLQVTSANKPWLCITTSRFPLIDIVEKIEFKDKQIFGVEGIEGAEILASHGINGNVKDRIMISNYLEGHPLGIKIFSASFTSTEDKNQPIDHFNTLFEGLNSDEISEKLNKLFWFYKTNASQLQINSLSALSVFRKGVALEVWLLLCKRLTNSVDVLDFDIKKSIGELMQIGLVLKDTLESRDFYSCHPLIRDFFNNSYLQDKPQSGRMIAKFLTESPDSIEIDGIASVERYIVAIEVFLKTGYEQEAIEIYHQRLKKGEIFLKLGAPKEAKRLHRMFIDYYVIQNKKQTRVGNYKTGNMDIIIHFVNPYIEYCIQLGEFHEAEKAISISEKYRQSSVCLRWRATIKFQQGSFSEAIVFCRRAIEMDKTELHKKDSKIESMIISYFLLFKIYNIIGEDSEGVQRKIYELFKLSSIKKLSDFGVRTFLIKLICAHNIKDEEYVRRYTYQIEEQLELINDWYFKLQTQLELAESYIYMNEFEKALKHVECVYRKSVKESYPYTLYTSSLLKAKLKFLTQDDSFNIDSVVTVYELSKTNKMPFISLMAIELVLKIKGNDEDFQEIRDYYKSSLGLI